MAEHRAGAAGRVEVHMRVDQISYALRADPFGPERAKDLGHRTAGADVDQRSVCALAQQVDRREHRAFVSGIDGADAVLEVYEGSRV
ncbi:MAG: hypothetical protein ABWY07_02630, partial [Burkholderiales bacterium]